jgi:hypothetical protein
MSQDIDLKEAERKAFRLSTSQDGLYDTFLGLLIILQSAQPWLDENGLRTLWNVLLVQGIMLIVLLGVLAIKKVVIAPRIGQVKFGPIRRRRIKRLAFGMIIIFILTVALFGMTIRAIYFREPLLDSPIQPDFPLDIVHTAAGIFIFAIFGVIGYMNDYPRMYLYGLLFGLGYIISTALQDITGNPFYWPWALAGLVAVITGLVLFTRFLRDYPVPVEPTLNEIR